MRTIIKITKQEDIDAWKAQNSHLLNEEDTSVEIEEGIKIPSITTQGITTSGGVTGVNNPYYYTTGQ